MGTLHLLDTSNHEQIWSIRLCGDVGGPGSMPG